MRRPSPPPFARRPRLLSLAGALAASLAWPAVALGASGLTVRLSTDTPMTDPLVELDDAGHPTTMTLKDDGQQPDVIEGDGTFAATAIASGGAMTITLRSGNQTWTTQSEAFPMGGGPRDLDLTLSGGTLVATPRIAGSVAPTPADGGPPNGGPPGSGPPGGGLGAPNGGDPGQPGVGPGGAPQGPATLEDDNGPLLIGLGFGLLAMAALGWRVFGRSDGAGAPALPGARRQAQAPALGAIGPSLSEGLALGVVEGEGLLPVAAAIIEALAVTYRVLVIVPDEVALPPMRGPILRAALDKPAAVGDAAEALEAQPGPPVAVVVIGQPARLLGELTEQLPETIGGLLLCGPDDAAIEPAAAGADPVEPLHLRLSAEGLHARHRADERLLLFADRGGLQLDLR